MFREASGLSRGRLHNQSWLHGRLTVGRRLCVCVVLCLGLYLPLGYYYIYKFKQQLSLYHSVVPIGFDMGLQKSINKITVKKTNPQQPLSFLFPSQFCKINTVTVERYGIVLIFCNEKWWKSYLRRLGFPACQLCLLLCFYLITCVFSVICLRDLFQYQFCDPNLSN